MDERVRRRLQPAQGPYELRLGEIPFSIAVKGGQFEAERGEAKDADATIRADPNAIASVVFGGNRLGKALENGEVAVEGSRKAANALFRALT